MNDVHETALNELRVRAPRAKPRVAVVLGSGWGGVTVIAFAAGSLVENNPSGS